MFSPFRTACKFVFEYSLALRAAYRFSVIFQFLRDISDWLSVGYDRTLELNEVLRANSLERNNLNPPLAAQLRVSNFFQHGSCMIQNRYWELCRSKPWYVALRRTFEPSRTNIWAQETATRRTIGYSTWLNLCCIKHKHPRYQTNTQTCAPENPHTPR
jgi:hypothetical protein